MKTRSYKCILSCILAVTLLFCMIPLVNISATTKDYLTGDANSDGIINVRDATQIQKAIASIIILDETQNLAADTDGNSEVNIKDATAIQKFVAGIETGLPFENIKPSVNPNVKKDTKNKIGYQLKMPQNGDIIAILHTSMGDITLRFFPENAPKAVENFIALAKDGKYDNTIFHRVIDDFVIQGGDFENGNGTGGVSSFGKPFEDEFCDTLYNIRGAVSMANAGKNTNGSQFFINQAKPESFSRSLYDYDKYYALYKEYYNSLIEAYGENFTQLYPTLSKFIEEYIGGINPLSYAVPEEVWDLYEKNGGNIHLDGALRASGGHTVFAQVIEGMDVVDNIAGVNVNPNTNKPLEDVTILSVEITTYKAN